MRKIVLTVIVMLFFRTIGSGSDEYKIIDLVNIIHKNVKIGDQIWMAENLNNKIEGSYCYENMESNCLKYGRLYIWDAAMQACPDGWHLPSKADFKILFTNVGGVGIAGKKLKSISGWSSCMIVDGEKKCIENGNGMDVFDFSAQPAGGMGSKGNYGAVGNYAFYWSATEDSNNNAYHMRLDYNYDGAYLIGTSKDLGFSIRCIKNVPMRDSRDGKTYKTVQIGNQTWMAENLNYAVPHSYCNKNNPANCAAYGRLYKYDAAQGACPSGWHLPSIEEFATLFVAVGGINVAGKKLKSTHEWGNYDGNGSDVYGFTALPVEDGKGARFWSSTEGKRGTYFIMYLGAGDSAILSNSEYHSEGSIRCLKDMDIALEQKRGTIEDLRDGKTYKTIQIGNQTWMAENLNYRTENSYCFKNEEQNCTWYGRLYKWEMALEACPKGWHLPSKEDFETLFASVGGRNIAGMMLKSRDDWKYGGNGKDAYGFTILPISSWSYGEKASFWSASVRSIPGWVYIISLTYYNEYATLEDIRYEYESHSVRCLKD